MKKISSREFEQDIDRAKREADQAPVTITDRNGPAYVLMRDEDYRRLIRRRPSILDLLELPGTEDIDFDPPRADIALRSSGLE